MKSIQVLILFPLFISGCSISTPTHSQENSTSISQVQKLSTEIRCEDLQNPTYQQTILQSINEIRQQARQCGQRHFSATSPLVWNEHLARSAYAHAIDMAQYNFLGHRSQAGLDLKARLKFYQFKGRGGGENVARGQKNLNEVLTTWLNSPMHCANIMNPKFTDYAVACTFDSTEKQKPYWAQQFGIR